MRVRLDRRRHAAYFDGRDVAARRETNEELRELAGRGLLRLRWRAWEEDNWLEAIDLAPGRAGELYRLLRRPPREKLETLLRELLRAQQPRADWHARFLTWAEQALSTHRRPAPLEPGDTVFNRDLLLALDAVARLSEPTLERTLSVRLFGDSKRLKALRHAVVAVLRAHDETAALYGGDEWALLRSHHLDRVPEYISLAGPFVLEWEDRRVDMSPFAEGVALPATTLHTARVAGCDARHVITVENATSFSQLVSLRAPRVFALYTGGFASPAVTSLLRRARAASPQARFFHWGDLDAGGLRILAHLRASLAPDVRPLAMDAPTFEEHRGYAQPLTDEDRRALIRLRAMPALADCVELIDRLLAEGRKLEQEAVSAHRALAPLGLE